MTMKLKLYRTCLNCPKKEGGGREFVLFFIAKIWISPIFHEKSQFSGFAMLSDVITSLWPIVLILVCMDGRDQYLSIDNQVHRRFNRVKVHKSIHYQQGNFIRKAMEMLMIVFLKNHYFEQVTKITFFAISLSLRCFQIFQKTGIFGKKISVL